MLFVVMFQYLFVKMWEMVGEGQASQRQRLTVLVPGPLVEASWKVFVAAVIFFWLPFGFIGNTQLCACVPVWVCTHVLVCDLMRDFLGKLALLISVMAVLFQKCWCWRKISAHQQYVMSACRDNKGQLQIHGVCSIMGAQSGLNMALLSLEQTY